MGDRMTQELVSQALFLTVTAKRPAAGLMYYLHRGSQYCAHDYRKILMQSGMVSIHEQKRQLR